MIADTLRTCSSQMLEGVAPDLWLVRDQLAKGLRLAAAVTTPYPLELDVAARATLVDCEVAAAKLGTERAGVAISALDDEDMLAASYIAPSEAWAGASAADVLVNLQRSFDEQIATRRYTSAGDPNWRTVTDVQALLDEQTVLVSLFLGSVPDGQLAVHAVALTRHEFQGTCIPQGAPSGLVQGILATRLRRHPHPVARRPAGGESSRGD